MNELPFPIIRLELEGMKRVLIKSLTEKAAEIDADIAAAVKAYCTPENLKRVVSEEVEKTLDSVLKEEIRNFFQYREGRTAVRKAVRERLLREEEDEKRRS